MYQNEFVALYTRELGKLKLEITAYGQDDDMWIVLPGTINSGGNLVQHLIGNLRTYIGLALGQVPYIRDRDAEFGKRLFTQARLLAEIDVLLPVLESTISELSDADLQKDYPRDVLVMFPEQSVSMILMHLLTHLSYHLGQINYHRRVVNTVP